MAVSGSCCCEAASPHSEMYPNIGPARGGGGARGILDVIIVADLFRLLLADLIVRVCCVDSQVSCLRIDPAFERKIV